MSQSSSGTSGSNNSKRNWGCGLLAGGLLVTVIAIGNIAVSSTLLFGDVMSGGMVPGHGQDEINRSAVAIALTTVFMVLGILAAVFGLVLLAFKRDK